MDVYLFGFDDQAVPHVVYDLSVPLEERKYKSLRFKSAHAAANWLGIPPKNLYKIRVPGRKVQRKEDGKWYAVRIAAR